MNEVLYSIVVDFPVITNPISLPVPNTTNEDPTSLPDNDWVNEIHDPLTQQQINPRVIDLATVISFVFLENDRVSEVGV